MPHRRIISLYEENASAWDEVRRAPTPGERVHLDDFAARLAPGARVLDIGCGSGVPIARDLLAAGLAVTGIDSSPSLIAMCRDRFPDAEWHVADMRRLDLGRRFDALLAWHSVFHLTAADQRAMFPTFAAHAAPGALLMFTSGDDEGEAIGAWQGEPLYHASLAPADYRDLLTANGFEEIAFAVGDPTAWLARFRG